VGLLFLAGCHGVQVELLLQWSPTRQNESGWLRMRVVTWNLWWRFGPWEARQKAILAELRELRPDVVGLQEVWAADGENQAEWLAGELGMHWTWAPSPAPERWRRRIGDPTVDIGNAVLSRWPVADRRSLRLPTPADLDDGRLALYARLATPSYDIPFFTAHLTSVPHGSAVRCRQVTALAEFVAANRVDTPFPAVVTGDFNACPDSDEIRLFGGLRTAPVVPGQVFFDAWQYADPAAPSATWDRANPYVASVLEPSVRIDYIHVAPPGADGLGHVQHVRRAGDGPVDGVWPSDHAAVVADLRDTRP
jgi:endonuclease/exonuclease/phosphatase family metal-dependent hydrolase